MTKNFREIGKKCYDAEEKKLPRWKDAENNFSVGKQLWTRREVLKWKALELSLTLYLSLSFVRLSCLPRYPPRFGYLCLYVFLNYLRLCISTYLLSL